MIADDLSLAEAKPVLVDDDRPKGIERVSFDLESMRPTADRSWWLLDANGASHRRCRRTNAFRVGPTDPDVSPMRDWGAVRIGYQDRYVVADRGKRLNRVALVSVLRAIPQRINPY